VAELRLGLLGAAVLRRCGGEEEFRGVRGRKGALGGFYTVEGQVERRGEVVSRWAPLMVVGKHGGRPGGGVSGEGRWQGARVNAPAHYWRRGGGAGAQAMAGMWRCGRP
jgi:hypothetical protein